MAEFSLSLEGMDAVREALNPAIYQAAFVSALNKTTDRGVTAATKTVIETYNIKRRDLWSTSTGRSRIKVIRARRGSLVVTVQLAGRSISLSYFGAVQRIGNKVITRQGTKTLKRTPRGAPAGVTVEVHRGKRTILPKAFISTVQAGRTGTHVGVWMRRTSARGPLLDKRIPTAATLFTGVRASDSFRKAVDEHFFKIFNHELNFRTQRR